jgi:hypothetical protein
MPLPDPELMDEAGVVTDWRRTVLGVAMVQLTGGFALRNSKIGWQGIDPRSR